MQEGTKQQEIKVSASQQVQVGTYTNTILIQHTKEEFVLDCMLIIPPSGILTSRVIISPGHMKRVLKALQANIKIYEDKFGQIKEAEEPSGKSTLGFQAPQQHHI
jgi:hypothetical protein